MLLTWRQASSPRPCTTSGLDAQQALFERLLLREPAGQQREYAIRVGGAPGGEPGARGAQAELGAVAAGGLGCQSLVEGRGAGMVTGADEFFGAIDVRWSATTGRGRTTREHRGQRDDDQKCKWSYQSFLRRHTSNSLHECLRILARWRIIVAANLGRLAVISTPIGNLGDLSPRARDELAAAELVAAEDTRRTGQLLTTLGLSRPLVSLHEHNERERIDELLEKLRAGRAHCAGERRRDAAAVGPGIRAGTSCRRRKA